MLLWLVGLWWIVRQPVALAMNYAFYFGAPAVLLVHFRRQIDERFGRAGWLLVFVLVAVGGPVLGGREPWWQNFALGVAAIWSAFYFSMLVQMIWYGVTQPWVLTPRPF